MFFLCKRTRLYFLSCCDILCTKQSKKIQHNIKKTIMTLILQIDEFNLFNVVFFFQWWGWCVLKIVRKASSQGSVSLWNEIVVCNKMTLFIRLLLYVKFEKWINIKIRSICRSDIKCFLLKSIYLFWIIWDISYISNNLIRKKTN